MIVQFRENGNQDFKVQITLLRLGIRVSFFTSVFRLLPVLTPQDCNILVNKDICLFLIPMPFCTFVLLFFLSFLNPLACLLFEFFIQAPLSIVSFCVRDVLIFQLTDGEELWQSCTHMVQYFVLIHIAFLGDFLLLFSFWLSILGMGSFIYNIVFTLLPFHGSFAVTP